MEKITKLIGNLNRNTVAKACRQFRSRIEVVVVADSDFSNKFILSVCYLSLFLIH
jgi:hypothetical protein